MSKWFTVMLDEIEVWKDYPDDDECDNPTPDMLLVMDRNNDTAHDSIYTLTHYSRPLNFKEGTSDDYINATICELLDRWYSPYDVRGWTYDIIKD